MLSAEQNRIVFCAHWGEIKKPAVPKDEPAAFYAPAGINNADDVIVVGSGPGTQRLNGFLDNTIVFKIVRDNL